MPESIASTEQDRLLDERAAAQILSCSPAMMRKWRLYGGGPEYCHLGRLVRYPISKLQAFIRTNMVNLQEKN
jgi:hypothetical protein